MAETYETYIALFDDVEHVVSAIAELESLGLEEKDIGVISGIPVAEAILGRKKVRELMARWTIPGAVIGFLVGIFFTMITPVMYPVRVGGQPFQSIPPSAVIIYEFTMLGIIISTLIGLLAQTGLPSYGRNFYHPEVSHGAIGLIFRCDRSCLEKAREVLVSLGANDFVPAKWRV